jgi:hypothetical protein
VDGTEDPRPKPAAPPGAGPGTGAFPKLNAMVTTASV